MHPLQSLIETTRWGSQNMAHNLDFIPQDKAHWKPAATASSVLGIVAHSAFALMSARAMMLGEQFDMNPDFDKLGVESTLESAKAEILQQGQAYIEFLEGLTPADLEGDIETPFGPFPKARFITFPVIDLVHHHGQLAYLQTMWGDMQSHFFEMGV